MSPRLDWHGWSQPRDAYEYGVLLVDEFAFLKGSAQLAPLGYDDAAARIQSERDLQSRWLRCSRDEFATIERGRLALPELRRRLMGELSGSASRVLSSHESSMDVLTDPIERGLVRLRRSKRAWEFEAFGNNRDGLLGLVRTGHAGDLAVGRSPIPDPHVDGVVPIDEVRPQGPLELVEVVMDDDETWKVVSYAAASRLGMSSGRHVQRLLRKRLQAHDPSLLQVLEFDSFEEVFLAYARTEAEAARTAAALRSLLAPGPGGWA